MGTSKAVIGLLVSSAWALSGCGSGPDAEEPGLAAAEVKSAPTIDDGVGRLCGLPDVAHLLASAVETPGGHWDYQDWIADAASQAALADLERALTPFSDSVLDIAVDHVSQRVVIAADRATLEEGALRKALETAQLRLPLRLQEACHDVKTLKAVGATLVDRGWHPKAKEQRFASYLDAGRGAWVVTFDRNYDASGAGDSTDAKANEKRKSTVEKVARALEKRLGSLVNIAWGSPARHGRLNDTERHFGGAGIGPTTSTHSCTAGFVVRRASSLSTIGAVTAGHCFANGAAVYSGPEFYGTANGKAAFPQFDMMRIDPTGELYTNVIHTGPSAPITRTQLGRTDPSVGQNICISGMITGAKCGAEVTTLTAGQICDADGCTFNLARAQRPGVTINQPGDSGAPIYTPSGATGAIINGMNLGANTCCSETLFHRVSQVESTLGVITMTP
ncbi:MAG: hypothetical protein K0R38_3614 [Polyangiaceae bacterium]|nr:hypothetical protein [Polyangiaceae bacterium]